MGESPLVVKLAARDRLSEPEREALRGLVARIRDYAPDEDIVSDGDHPGHSSLMLEGFCCRYKLLSDGRRQITAFHISGDFCDLHSFVLKTMDHGVMALTKCQVAQVPHERLARTTERWPHLTRMLWLSTLIDAAIHREWIIGMGRRSAQGRIAHLFCELFVRLKVAGRTKDNGFALPITQTELSDALGISLVHTNRTISMLRKKKLATFANGTVTIENWKALAELAEFDPTYLHLESEPR
jgi:CRP-like cAMP-binding protein